ncbi:metallophosphoesterase [Nonomuraea sp. NPDC050310]|uniref:metallophosphoesterase n=1 Tax=Nonomuraea sp. NPDC050310 TaxID=3154935 RepID=UPI0033C91FA7
MSTYTLLHLTDVHITPGGLLHGAADSLAALRSAVAAASASGTPIDALVLSGDLADQGDEASYRTLREVVEGSGLPMIAAMGNHDERAAFRSALLGEEPSDEPYDRVSWIRGLRVVTLDSTVPGAHHGELDEAQLDRLAGVLAEPAPDGTVLVLHHPPIRSVLPLMDGIGLREPEKLAGVLAGTDVRLVLAGHTHSATWGTLAGIPVWVGPGNAYGADTLPPAGITRALNVQAFTRIDLGPDGPLITVVPLTQAPPVYELATERLLSHLVSHSG